MTAPAISLATWNVNSLKVRLPHLSAWLAAHPVDVVCLQETKCTDERFPLAELTALGYECHISGQPTYNGVAVLVRTAAGLGPIQDPVRELPGLEDPQRRLLAVTVGGMRVVCAYFPNGQAVDSDKFAYKLRWLQALQAFLAEEATRHPALALLGDFNIAPEDRDVHDPALWAGQILCSEPERDAFARLLGLGLHDAFRRFEQPERAYSWWDYRDLAFRRKRGLRIDHILLSEALAARCIACRIDAAPRALERPSDHAPVIVEISRPETAPAPCG
jgi:exodeoxyribonuclease-3